MSLIRAAKSGDLTKLKRELAVAGSLDTTDSDGLTPLHHAVVGGYDDLVRELLKNGASVTAKTLRGNTPLHIAVVDAPGLVGILLQEGAELNAVNRAGQTPLHLAAAEGTATMVRDLLYAGANPLLKDDKGRTPLDVATDPEIREAFARAGVRPEDDRLAGELEGLGMGAANAPVGQGQGWGGEEGGRRRRTRKTRRRATRRRR